MCRAVPSKRESETGVPWCWKVQSEGQQDDNIVVVVVVVDLPLSKGS